MLELCQTTGEKQAENGGGGMEYPTRGRRQTIRERLKQFAHDWALPEGAIWLSARDIAAALQVSRRHVFALIQDGSFDCAIDLRAPGARQAYWRIWRTSFVRFGQRARGEACGRFRFELELSDALAAQPPALTGQDLAAHFRCSKQHIYNLVEELPNVGTVEADRALVRVSKAELLGLIKKRMV
jgi:hypothetical protein